MKNYLEGNIFFLQRIRSR